MPMQQGSSREVIAANIKQLITEGHERSSAVAVALREAGKSADAPTLEEVLAKYNRVAVTGTPRAGKTTLSGAIADRPVVHTDPNDLRELYPEGVDWSQTQEVWDAAPAFIAQAVSGRDRFVVEGVSVARALRRGLEVDAVIVMVDPLIEQSPGQAAMGLGVLSILDDWMTADTVTPVFVGTNMVPDQKTVTRYATATLDSTRIQTTEQGGIRVPARLTKSDVFAYNRGGQMVREWRPPEEVLAEESWSTIKSAPVVVLHPMHDGGTVTTDNYRRLNVGTAEDPTPADDDSAIDAWLVINDSATVRQVLDRTLVDVSMGYTNVWENTPGVTPDGKPYDAIQRRIRYNHVALLPKGRGRQGADVSITLDADDNEQLAGNPAGDTDMSLKTTGVAPVIAAVVAGQAQKVTTSDEGVSAFTAEQIAALTMLAQIAPSLAKLLEASQPAPTVDVAAPAPVAAPPAPVAPVPPVTAAAVPPAPPAAPVAAPAMAVAPEKKTTTDAADFDRAVSETVDLHMRARGVLGHAFEPKGKTNRQIKVAVVQSLDSDWTDTVGSNPKSDEVVNEAFELAIRRRGSNVLQLATLRGANPQVTTDSNETPAPKSLGELAYHFADSKTRVV
jgi:hypothetical protein